MPCVGPGGGKRLENRFIADGDELPPLLISRRAAAKEASEKKGDKNQQSTRVVIPNRVRQFVIMPDLLNSTGSANLRVVRDTYYLLIGPSTEPNVEAIRRGFLIFVIDPLTERQVKEVAAIRGPLKNLMETRGDKLDPEYSRRSAG